ncbi:hypothetical protein CEUSTIGMA_g5231.t1 [Chlamydomonas eustigma]|uniref:Uncharacterized protein n=1 Tax=Chlamydomonas eustigma TaxID=1157962 RepID=A0A250X3Y4_9CHLO|nr:hypothetical protein CEUSTIGMA_g5231.t1 [Chlamydomonas eustigma]|eukprot:GAX77788.1 hypothetical protein CEUSTIGMA_g5231.t1 [Chlamydomonas eustigma]
MFGVTMTAISDKRVEEKLKFASRDEDFRMKMAYKQHAGNLIIAEKQQVGNLAATSMLAAVINEAFKTSGHTNSYSQSLSEWASATSKSSNSAPPWLILAADETATGIVKF